LNQGILPPHSGSWHNPYSDWIGAQMRGMICGLLSPALPFEAARLAHIDGVVSHSANGLYGEMYAAALTALAFMYDDPCKIVIKGLDYLPQNSEYITLQKKVVSILENNKNAEKAWTTIKPIYEHYNWIHAYPNAAADVFALWYGGSDFSETMSLLAYAGNDVDCNAGLVGTILGVISPVPQKWAAPIGDLLETYIKGKEKLSIQKLAKETARLAKEKRKSQK
jgi:ADP-ribosylglycohydrolase